MQFGYYLRFTGLIFLDVFRGQVLRPGRRGYSGFRREGILEWSFGNAGERGEEVGAARMFADFH